MARINRRAFLQGLAVAAVPNVIYSSSRGAIAPSERVVVASIGVGPQGTGLLNACLGHAEAQVVTICDVNAQRRQAACDVVNGQYGNKDCRGYNDFRDLLARDDIDAVIIASCDHWHVLHGLAAARAKKDMYIEKPLGVCLAEDQALRAAVHRHERIFQFGTQQRSSWEFRMACELVRNKRIGELKVIKVGAPASRASENLTPEPVPDWLDYEMWLGPAPAAPFSNKRIIDNYWWHNSDYAVGFVAGWGIHHVDIAQWGIGADGSGPVGFEGRGVFPSDGFCNCATKWNMKCRYANGVLLDYTDDGQNRHGIRFEGTNGWVHVARGSIDAEPKSLLPARFGPNDIRLYKSRDHMGNFLECVKTRAETACPIDTAVSSDAICYLSDIAMRTGRKLQWDPAREVCVGDAEANRMLMRSMRAPWAI